jgi:hypothetical protein
MELFRLYVPYSSCLVSRSNRHHPPAFPSPSRLPVITFERLSSRPSLAHPGRATFTALLRYYSGRPTAEQASLAFSLTLISSLTAVPPADPTSSPEVTSLFFRIVPPAITLIVVGE